MANVIAIIWDFDKTLVQGYMQAPIFKHYKLDGKKFWEEVHALPQKFLQEQNVKVNRDTIYLNHFINYSAPGKPLFGLNNAQLREFGKELEFFPGVLEWFSNINKFGKEQGVIVEHYLVSSGNKEIVEGTPIAKEFKVIYGCEYLYDEETGLPIWPKLAINFTQKTQYMYRISKGVYDQNDDVGVNEKRQDRRIPYSNMIYIGDGMTDIPAMIIAKNNGGHSIAVYPRGQEEKVQNLIRDMRVNSVCPADYRVGKEIDNYIRLIIQNIAIETALGKKEIN